MLDLEAPAATPIGLIGDMIRTIGTDQFEAGLLGLLAGIAGVGAFCVRARPEGAARVCRLTAGGGDADCAPDQDDICRLRCAPSFHPGDPRLAVLQGPPGADGGLMLVCTAEAESFDAGDRRRLASYAPVLLGAIAQHLAVAPPPRDGSAQCRASMVEEVKRDLLADGGVSPREAEVCAYIALGYNITAISLNLGISQNTAATHRKRAYSKLRISSQNELFARFFNLAA